MASPLPAVIDDLTAEWLGPALDLEIEGITVEPLGASVGLLGDLARVRIHDRSGTGLMALTRRDMLMSFHPGDGKGSMNRAFPIP